jgi:hypothetical protein
VFGLIRFSVFVDREKNIRPAVVQLLTILSLLQVPTAMRSLELGFLLLETGS